MSLPHIVDLYLTALLPSHNRQAYVLTLVCEKAQLRIHKMVFCLFLTAKYKFLRPRKLQLRAQDVKP